MVVLSQPAKAKFVREPGCSHLLRLCPQRPIVSPHPHERRDLNSHRGSPCAVPTRSDSAARLASFPRPDGTRRTSHAFRWPGRTENQPPRTRLNARSNCSLDSQNSIRNRCRRTFIACRLGAAPAMPPPSARFAARLRTSPKLSSLAAAIMTARCVGEGQAGMCERFMRELSRIS
jgi:hypothetical protein